MKKLFLMLSVTILLIGALYTPAFGANQAVTTGVALFPYMLEGEYEFIFTNNSTLCLRTGITLFFGELTGVGVGYRWYYNSEALDGFYCGGCVDYFKFEGFDFFNPVTKSFVAGQGFWGYKKVLGDWFVFDLGLSAYAGESDGKFQVIPGVVATLGFAF
ncbi:MAG TPA: hypothetical protein VHY08_11715 [Bacillota bacterium]|nr:hypothetical protein [Bacillota bacterium]